DPNDPDPAKRPRLVAATRPIPNGFPLSLAISSDNSYLYVTYNVPVEGRSSGALFVYDINAIKEEIDHSVNLEPRPEPTDPGDGTPTLIARYAVDDVWDGFGGDSVANLNIDVRAALRVDPTSPRFDYAFEIFQDDQAPIAIGGYASGVATQPVRF